MDGTADLGKVSGAVCGGNGWKCGPGQGFWCNCHSLWGLQRYTDSMCLCVCVAHSNICDLRSGDSQHITSFRRAKTQHVRSVTQSCLTLCIPHGVRSPGSSVHGILQARILEWVAMPSSRGSFQSRDWTQASNISCTAGEFFTTELPGNPPLT